MNDRIRLMRLIKKSFLALTTIILLSGCDAETMRMLNDLNNAMYGNTGTSYNSSSSVVGFKTGERISGFNKININSKDSIDISNISSDLAKIASHEKTINHPRKVLINRSDVYIKEAGIKKIDLLKLDTQGYELEILNGFGDSLKSVRVIISELMLYDFYDKSLSFYEFEKIISPFGFKLYDINHIAKNPMNGRTDWVDVIYLNENF